MALIVEDGTVVVDANSYNTRAELIAFAGLRGVVLPNDESTDYKAIEAMDYLELFRNDYLGHETDPENQYLSWPRTGVTVGPVIVGKNSIPRKIKEAQALLTVYAVKGLVLIPNRDPTKPYVTRKKMGPMETEWSEAVALGATSLPTMPAVAALLAPYIGSVGGGVTRTYRA